MIRSFLAKIFFKTGQFFVLLATKTDLSSMQNWIRGKQHLYDEAIDRGLFDE